MSDMINGVPADEYSAEDTLSNKYLTFKLDQQEYAIAIQYVVDIINVQPVTRVPSCPDFVRGITNLRGKVIPIIDVRTRFGKSQQAYDERTCIIVVELDDMSVGLIVDSVSEVIVLEDEDVSPPPSFSTNVDVRFINGIGRAKSGITLILDCKTVLDDNSIPTPDAQAV